MALTLPVSNPAATLRDEVDRAGGELTMAVQAVLELFSDGSIDSNARRRARQGLAEHQLACEPDLVQAGPEGFVTIYTVKPVHVAPRPTESAHEEAPSTKSLHSREWRRAAVPVGTDEVPSPSKPRQGVTPTARVAAVIALALAVLLAASFAAWTLGKNTRKSDAAVATTVEQAVAQRGELAKSDQADAVRSAKAAQRARDAKRARKHLKKVVAKTKKASYDKGYSAGNSAGYSAGNSVGYSAGNEAGVEEGVEKASDELTCSDDSDVDLPACFMYDY